MNSENQTVMRVKKRNGALQDVDVNKIVRAVQRCSTGLLCVDPMRVASKTIGGLYDGATTAELDRLSIQTAAALIADEPEYSKLAARLLAAYVDKEVENQGVYSFSQSVTAAHGHNLINDRTAKFVEENARKLNAAAAGPPPDLYEYFGLRTVYDRYLIRHPTTRKVIETPAYFLLRVACGLSDTVQEAVAFFKLTIAQKYMPSTPTLFNSGGRRSQLASCFLVQSPRDDLNSIYDRYKEIANLSKYSGGIGVAYHRVRSRGSLISTTNGPSNGIVSWLKTLDSSVASVNQGSRRPGACCVYLECWHADVEEFLELRDNTGDPARRTYNLNLANWIPDLFMRRVEADQDWSLFDPKLVPHLPDLYGPAFDTAYEAAEKAGLAAKTIPARDLYGKMMRTLAETGNGWMTFKDACNLRSNQTGADGNVVHSSNLCTEVVEVSNDDETATCNLGSVNLANHVRGDTFDFDDLALTVRTAVTVLDKTIDANFYPTPAAEKSNKRWRPLGLGMMGLQDVFFKLRLPFDSKEAREFSTRIQEEVYYTALDTSCHLAAEHGRHPSYEQTRIFREGKLQFDLWGVTPSDVGRWNALKVRIAKHGLRNSLLIATAPTATIASIVGAYECVEPQISNLFKRETMSGEFLQVNKYLVADLKALGLWTDEIKNKIRLANGSVQGIPEIPDDLRALYRTVWEVPMRALIDMAAARGPYVDQSQSINLFMESPTIGKLSSMYLYAWKSGMKTLYYLRSRPATEIAKTTVTKTVKPVEAVTCSLENPAACDSCQ